ncbi:MAG: hypothetical protein LBL59_08195 [Xanthomonadaceae bacterium]|jgi:hypothetical protein|nr:hypothetical protein [Xanthomonadaceae bacterium]
MPDRTIELEAIPWERLWHAYGRVADTPVHLRALLTEDTQAWQSTFSHLHSAILHQGTPCLATAPCVAVLIDWLLAGYFDPVVEHQIRVLRFLLDVTEVPLIWRDDLLQLWELAMIDVDLIPDDGYDEVKEHLFGEKASHEALYARSVLGCLDVMPGVQMAMERSLDGDDPHVRVIASSGLANIVRLPDGLQYREGAVARIRDCAETAIDSNERAIQVLALGTIGMEVSDYLDDPAVPVRLCAALAPNLADHERATGVLIESMERHGAEIDGWFKYRPPQFAGWPRFAVVAALLERVSDFERLAGVAIVIARISHANHVDHDWGPLLCAAFIEGDGQVRTRSQYRYLDALVNNESLWNPRLGNAHRWFHQAGLVYDREDCQRRLAAARDDHV